MDPNDQHWCLEQSVLLQWRDQFTQQPTEGLHATYALVLIDEVLRLRQQLDQRSPRLKLRRPDSNAATGQHQWLDE